MTVMEMIAKDEATGTRPVTGVKSPEETYAPFCPVPETGTLLDALKEMAHKKARLLFIN